MSLNNADVKALDDGTTTTTTGQRKRKTPLTCRLTEEMARIRTKSLILAGSSSKLTTGASVAAAPGWHFCISSLLLQRSTAERTCLFPPALATESSSSSSSSSSSNSNSSNSSLRPTYVGSTLMLLSLGFSYVSLSLSLCANLSGQEDDVRKMKLFLRYGLMDSASESPRPAGVHCSLHAHVEHNRRKDVLRARGRGLSRAH